jgi:3-hydroxy-3-methylglutaryl CoA synthase
MSAPLTKKAHYMGNALDFIRPNSMAKKRLKTVVFVFIITFQELLKATIDQFGSEHIFNYTFYDRFFFHLPTEEEVRFFQKIQTFDE